jgi:hypothetical protein
MTKTLCAVAVAGLAGSAFAAIDGTDFQNKYGQAVWVQNLGTGFGNNDNADTLDANGSELNALYAQISGGKLRLGYAGNLHGFNKINIALDYQAGGQNQLGGLANLGNLSGLTLDSGVAADAVLSFTSGFGGSNSVEWYVDGSLADGTGGFLGGGPAAGPRSVSLGGAAVTFFMNNSNVAGVAGFGDPFSSDPATVFTGLEVEIDLAALGYAGGAIKLASWINGASNDFMSNQVVGGLPDGTGNLGGDGNGNFTGNVSGIDFNQFAGDQFVTIIPAPGSMALLGLGGLAAARRRR